MDFQVKTWFQNRRIKEKKQTGLGISQLRSNESSRSSPKPSVGTSGGEVVPPSSGNGPYVTDGSKRLAATSDEGTPSKKKQKCSTEESFDEIQTESGAENEIEQPPPLARPPQQLPQHLQHQHQQQRQHGIHQANGMPDPSLDTQALGTSEYPITEAPQFSTGSGHHYPVSMAGPYTSRPNEAIQGPLQPHPHVQQYGGGVPLGMVNESGVPIRREPLPQHGGAIAPMSTANEREFVPHPGVVMPMGTSTDSGVLISRPQHGNVIPMGVANDVGVPIQKETMPIRGQMPANQLVGNEKQTPHGFMQSAPGHIPHSTGIIHGQRLPMNPGHMPQYSDSAIMPSEQGHNPINRMPVNMTMDQGHISRHMAPSRLSVNAGGLRAFSEDQRMQYLNNAHLQARMAGYGHPF